MASSSDAEIKDLQERIADLTSKLEGLEQPEKSEDKVREPARRWSSEEPMEPNLEDTLRQQHWSVLAILEELNSNVKLILKLGWGNVVSKDNDNIKVAVKKKGKEKIKRVDFENIPRCYECREWGHVWRKCPNKSRGFRQ
jgi:hypothetical protein